MARAETPTEVFRRQLVESRESRRWNQTELAERLRALGSSVDRSALAKIEAPSSPRSKSEGKTPPRKVSLDEAFEIALALGVAPIHLFVPRKWGRWSDADGRLSAEQGDRIQLAPVFEESAMAAARWVRGEALLMPLPDDDLMDAMKAWISERSDYELDAFMQPGRADLQTAFGDVEAAITAGDDSATLTAIKVMKRALDEHADRLQKERLL